MSNVRKLMLLAVMALAATALAAPAASAQGIQVDDEATGDPCPTVFPNNSAEFPLDSAVTGGCVAHATNTEGLVVLTAHIFGIESADSLCNNEFTARIGANGEGYLTDVELSGAECGRRPCGTAAGAPEAWELHGEEDVNGTRLEAHFCVENVGGGGRQTCHLFMPFRADPNTTHGYEFGTVSVATPQEVSCEDFTGFRAEVSGHWRSETTSFEVVHL